MSYIGNEPIVSATRTVTEITATAGQTTFTANGGYTVGYIDVFVNGAQLQSSDFTATNGTSITLNSPALAGDDIRLVAWGTFSLAGSLTPAAVSNQSNTSTGYFAVPSGTTAQRPASPANGFVRYNTTLNQFEVYQNSNWVQYSTSYSIDYLVVAGGGGGGSQVASVTNGGGGGAGGVLSGSASIVQGFSYLITVGAGGSVDTNGQNSSINLLATANGGGAGAGITAGAPGGNGGSGGGGSAAGGGGAGGSGTSGQGNSGGVGSNGGAFIGGGGGGAGAPGTNGASGGHGGNGISSSITGTSTFYGGGGGGGGNTGNFGTGGSGGGGRGGTNVTNSAVAGTANTGGGGGGSANNTNAAAPGGSGIVIIRYAGSQRGTGGTVTSSGGFTIHTFTTSGTFTA